MMASSSAITTRVGKVLPSPWSAVGRDKPVEQLVLGRLEPADIGGERIAVAAHRVGVALGLAALRFGERRL